jgi:CHAD domain-containing protein
MPVADLLASVMERRLAALRRHLPGALDGDATGVHQARVASRRLREVLPVLVAEDADKVLARAQRAVRRVTRTLGPVRELDVALGVLNAHLEAHPDEVVEGLVVRGWLERWRATRREEMLEQLTDRRVARLWTRMERLGEVTSRLSARADAPWRPVLGNRILTRAVALREDVSLTGVLYAPEPLHGVRIGAKKLRYAMELAGDLRLGATAAVVRALKRHQDLLGRIHDLEVLTSMADRACADAPRRVHAARLVGDWHRECRELHAKYVRSRATLQRSIEAARLLGRRLAGPKAAPRARKEKRDG